MDDVKVLLDSIERIYGNIDNIEEDSFKNKFNQYVLIKGNLDAFRDRLDTIKANLNDSNIEESKNEINKILSELLGDGEKEEVAEIEEFNSSDISGLLNNMPDEVYQEDDDVENTNDNMLEKTEVLFDVSEIEDALNNSNESFVDQEITEEILPEEEHIEESNLDTSYDESSEILNSFEMPTLESFDSEMIDIPTLEELPTEISESPVAETTSGDEIETLTEPTFNLDELNSMIETFE